MGWPRTSGDSGAASAISDAPRHRRGRRVLRAGLAALALILMAPAGAVAADMPEFLRGSYTPTYTRWEGFYFGAQAGKTSGSADFGNADPIHGQLHPQPTPSCRTTSPAGPRCRKVRPAAQAMAASSATIGSGTTSFWAPSSTTTTCRSKIGAEDTIGPILVPGANLPDGSTVYYSVVVTSAASVSIHDIVTARARAGWTFDRFMPYGFAGVAVGRADTRALQPWPAAPKRRRRPDDRRGSSRLPSRAH